MTKLCSLDLNVLEAVSGGMGNHPSYTPRPDPTPAPGRGGPRPPAQPAPAWIGQCLGGAVIGGLKGIFRGGVPGIVGGAIAGCITSPDDCNAPSRRRALLARWLDRAVLGDALTVSPPAWHQDTTTRVLTCIPATL